MRIRDVAKLFEIKTSKIRFLEAQGLVHPRRNPFSGYRHYNETDVERLYFILRAQSFGFRISEIRRVFAESGGGTPRRDLVIEHMTIKLDELRRDIDRACATRDRLIEGINAVKTPERAQEQAGVTQRPVHVAALISLARLEGSLRLRRVDERSAGRQENTRRPSERHRADDEPSLLSTFGESSP